MERREHWENIHATKASDEVSWFEVDPRISFDLIESVSPERGSVIDVGGGQSFLVDKLLSAGYERVAVLDISSAALESTKERLAEQAGGVAWIHADVTKATDLGTFDVWHDRAVFHFLTDDSDRRAYVDRLTQTLPISGHFVIGTFGIGGPEKCSGLEIRQYDAESMQATLGSHFELVRSLDQVHVTPADKEQKFFFGVFRRV
jgi:2-polyprenyl-3-methyl-5-hydroxy-6-metoxy-1,4-benzoquinol methylase